MCYLQVVGHHSGGKLIRFLSVASGFSAGFILCVSFVEFFVKGSDALTATHGDYQGHGVKCTAFFGGNAGIIPPAVMCVLFDYTSGVMDYLCLNELSPTS